MYHLILWSSTYRTINWFVSISSEGCSDIIVQQLFVTFDSHKWSNGKMIMWYMSNIYQFATHYTSGIELFCAKCVFIILMHLVRNVSFSAWHSLQYTWKEPQYKQLIWAVFWLWDWCHGIFLKNKDNVLASMKSIGTCIDNILKIRTNCCKILLAEFMVRLVHYF